VRSALAVEETLIGRELLELLLNLLFALASEARWPRRIWVCERSGRRKLALGSRPAAISCNALAAPASVSRVDHGLPGNLRGARSR